MKNKQKQIKKPNFFIVGTQKAGTTTIHNILNQHPQIFLPNIKETKFFQDNKQYKKGIKYYLKKYFKKAKDNQILGEIDPEYMYFEEVPKRIYNTLGKDVKIIFILRNPLDRAYSHYLMSVRRGYEHKSFTEALKLEKFRIKEGEFEKNNFSYMSRGFYSKQIKRYLKYFPKENMIFLLFEEFTKNKERTIKRIFDLIEIKKDIKLNFNINFNKKSSPRFILIRDFIYKEFWIKKLFRKIIYSREIRSKIARKLDKINSKKDNKEDLSSKLKQKLFNKYFLNDVKRLKKIIGKNLDLWNF